MIWVARAYRDVDTVTLTSSMLTAITVRSDHVFYVDFYRCSCVNIFEILVKGLPGADTARQDKPITLTRLRSAS
jgi:hypothetical protein